MALVAFVQRTSSGNGSGSAQTSGTFGSAVTSGNLLVVGIQAQDAGGGISSITDTGGNSYTVVSGSPQANGVNYNYIAYAKNVTGGSSFVISVNLVNSAGNYFIVRAYEISGADRGAPFLTMNKASGASTALSSGSLTISQNAIICAFFEEDSGSGTSITVGTGYTQFSSDSQYIHDMYHIVSTSEAATATLPSVVGWGVIAAAFAEATTATWTLIEHDTKGVSSGTAVTINNGGSGYNTYGVDLIVVTTSEFGFGGYTDGSVTDNKGNTYTPLTIYSSPHELMQMFYTWGTGITVGSGHTITFTTGNGDTAPAMAFQAWIGSLTSSTPLDASNGNSNYDPGSPFNSLSTNSVTPAASTDIAVTGINVRDVTSSQLAISGYTISDKRDNTPGNQIAMAYKILSSTSTETPTWTWTDTKTEAAASIAVFLAAGGSPPASTFIPHRMLRGIG